MAKKYKKPSRAPRGDRATALFAKLSKKYPTPSAVQKFLRTLPYNRERRGETLLSASQAYRRRRAHCLEAAILAAAILEQRGYPPLVMSLESVDDLDHVIFIFREKTGWGAIARSRDNGLHGRAPVYPTLRALTESYHAAYVDQTGRITGYGKAHLDDSAVNWRSGRGNLWKLEQFLIDLKHRPAPQPDKVYRRLHERYLARGPLPLPKNAW